jgi:hypothetical protein
MIDFLLVSIAIAMFLFFGSIFSIGQMLIKRMKDKEICDLLNLQLSINRQAVKEQIPPQVVIGNSIVGNSNNISTDAPIKSPNVTTTKYQGEVELWKDEEKKDELAKKV